MGHKHSVYDSDAHFSIDPITRKIKNESSKKTTLVQGDHNSERCTFDVPRFIEGHDMMQCSEIEVHYDNFEAGTDNVSSDYYEVKDKQISPDDENVVIFSWLIIDTATKYAGTLEFSIKFKCVEDGVSDYEWNTLTNTDLNVGKGKNNSGVVVEREPNVVDQWKAEIFGDAENAVANINLAEQNALAAVREEGAAQVVAIQGTCKNIVEASANAIKGHLKGEVVVADDVSPVEHEMNVKVVCPDGIEPTTVNVRRCGKNLFPMFVTDTTLKNGSYTKVQDDGSLLIHNAGDIIRFEHTIVLPVGDYIMSNGEMVKTDKVPYIILKIGDESYYQKNKFTLTESTECLLTIYGWNEFTGDFVFYPQIEKGNEQTDFEPYKGTDHKPSSDGTVSGMMSTSPNMTILTDTEGVVIDCEYNVDTKTYIDKKFEELKNTILSES